MFLDASAIVAILGREPEREVFLAKLQASPFRVTSVVSIYEAALALNRMTGSCVSALSEIQLFTQAARIEVRQIDPAMLQELAITWDRFGKGSRGGGKLNMGDCFTYVFAKLLGLPLLFKGQGFLHTDIVPA